SSTELTPSFARTRSADSTLAASLRRAAGAFLIYQKVEEDKKGPPVTGLPPITRLSRPMTATDKRPYALQGLLDASRHPPQIDFATRTDCVGGPAQSSPAAGNALALTQLASSRSAAHAPQGIWPLTSKKQPVSVSQRR
ncbi:MAG: hypothetical protein BJ554DRAFT_5075, partial [Olpidium bornovanus]